MKRLILLGAGHSHLLVLKRFARLSLPQIELLVVTPSPWQYYSGMIPGWMIGNYDLDEARIAVETQVKAAKGVLILDKAVSISAETRQIELAGGQCLTYDFLSIDIGSQSNLLSLHGLKIPLMAVKPIEQFIQQWDSLRRNLSEGKPATHLVLLGGGAAGVELALAAAVSLKASYLKPPAISLVTGKKGLLPGFSLKMRRLVYRALAEQGVVLYEQPAVAKEGKLFLEDGSQLEATQVIAATDSRPLELLAKSGLKQDAKGFVLVDSFHRTLSHPEVFAAGDTCSRSDKKISRSGVHAVRAGAVLACNLEASLSEKKELQPFYPRPHSLYLLASGYRSAIGSYGLLTFSGYWVWQLKKWIDQRFIKGFGGSFPPS